MAGTGGGHRALCVEDNTQLQPWVQRRLEEDPHQLPLILHCAGSTEAEAKELQVLVAGALSSSASFGALEDGQQPEDLADRLYNVPLALCGLYKTK